MRAVTEADDPGKAAAYWSSVDRSRAAHPSTMDGVNVVADSISTALTAKQSDLDNCVAFIEDQLADLDDIVNTLDIDSLDRAKVHAAVVNLFDAFTRGTATASKLANKLGPQSERLKSQVFRLSDSDHV